MPNILSPKYYEFKDKPTIGNTKQGFLINANMSKFAYSKIKHQKCFFQTHLNVY